MLYIRTALPSLTRFIGCFVSHHTLSADPRWAIRDGEGGDDRRINTEAVWLSEWPLETHTADAAALRTGDRWPAFFLCSSSTVGLSIAASLLSVSACSVSTASTVTLFSKALVGRTTTNRVSTRPQRRRPVQHCTANSNQIHRAHTKREGICVVMS